MKKIILVIALLLISLIPYSQSIEGRKLTEKETKDLRILIKLTEELEEELNKIATLDIGISDTSWYDTYDSEFFSIYEPKKAMDKFKAEVVKENRYKKYYILGLAKEDETIIKFRVVFYDEKEGVF